MMGSLHIDSQMDMMGGLHIDSQMENVLKTGELPLDFIGRTFSFRKLILNSRHWRAALVICYLTYSSDRNLRDNDS